MKTKIFYGIVIIICLCLTGCTTDYKIKVTEDLKIKEEASFKEDLTGYNNMYGEEDNMNFSDAINEYKQYGVENGYEVSDKSTATYANLTFKRTSAFIDFNSPIIPEIYTYFDTSCDDDKCSITSVAKQDDTEGDGTYMNYKISITVPYKVLKQNANEVDLKNNTYIWYYNVTGEKSNIDFVFEKKGTNIIETNKQKSFIITVIYIIIGIAVFITVASIIFRIMKNSKPRF